MRLRSTHTFAELAISAGAWTEIAELLRVAGYSHAIIDGRVIDMHGIGLTVRPDDGEAAEPEFTCDHTSWRCVCDLARGKMR